MLGNMKCVSIVQILMTALSGSTCLQYTSSSNMRMTAHAFDVFICTGMTECLYTCMTVRECESLNWKKSDRTCELNEESSSSAPDSMVAIDMDYLFFDIMDWPTSLVGDCANHACGSKERCIPPGVCIPACGPPPKVNNSVSTVSRTEGSIRACTYECREGFDPVPYDLAILMITCGSDSQWTDVYFECIVTPM